jgi:hypothetical protein
MLTVGVYRLKGSTHAAVLLRREPYGEPVRRLQEPQV